MSWSQQSNDQENLRTIVSLQKVNWHKKCCESGSGFSWIRNYLFRIGMKTKNIYISKFHLWFFAAIVQKKTVEYSFKAIAVGWFFILIEYNPFSYNFGSRIFFSWIRNVFLDPKFFPGSGTLENTELYSDPDPEKNYFGSLPVGDAEDIIPTILQAELVQSEYL